MRRNSTELNYRRAAVHQASPAGLVVILYDLLVEDLQRAIAAMRRSAIEERSRHLKHALLVLQLLEGSLDMEKGGAAAGSLAAFYGHVRSQLMDAHFRSDLAPLQCQIALLLDVRQAWRTVESQPPPGASSPLPSHSTPSVPESAESTHQTALTWSA